MKHASAMMAAFEAAGLQPKKKQKQKKASAPIITVEKRRYPQPEAM